MYKPLLILFCCVIIFSSGKIVDSGNKNIEWLKLDEVNTKLKQQNKPVIIDLYTDWCHWCKVMDKKTYSNQKVIDYITDHFYASKVNAETKESVSWRNKTYSYNDTYHINDFTLYATSGQPSFPTTVIIPDENAAPIPIAGFMEPKEIEPILKYFGDGAYKTQAFPEFQKTFHSSW